METRNDQRFSPEHRASPAEQSPVLGSRKHRHAKRKLRYATMIGSGLALFGALFLGLFITELYQANKGKQGIRPDAAAAEQQAGGNDGAAANEAKHNPSIGADALQGTAATTGSGSSASQPGASATGSGSSASQPGESATGSGSNITKRVSSKTAATTSTGESSSNSASSVKPAVVPDNKRTVKRHIIQKGDTLFKLSRQYYGSNFGVDRIVRYNGLDPNQQLPIGKAIMIPLGKE